MKFLVDTHILLWWLINDRRLPGKAFKLLEDPRNEVLVSCVSVWEIVLKHGLGKIRINPSDIPPVIESSQFKSLPVGMEHVLKVSDLPFYHPDPFDRLLIAQAIVETARLLTHDAVLARYGQVVLVV